MGLTPSVPCISAEEVRALGEAASDGGTRALVYLDVRTQEEHERDNIGGHNVPLDDLRAALPRLQAQWPSDTPIIVYCARGRRSAMATDMLLREGKFTDVRSLSGGLEALRSRA